MNQSTMSIEPEIVALPDEVKSVNIKEQKVFDGLSFPLILTPKDAFKEKNAQFWNEWVKKNLKVIEKILLKYGAILFRGLPLDTPKEFDDFAKAYGYDPFSDVGGSGHRNSVVGNVYTASETVPAFIIPLHHEMAHIKDWPYILFFYCDIPAKEGGNTPIAISNVIYRKMAERDPDFVRRLQDEGMRYSRVAPDKNDERNPYGRTWQSTCYTSNREEAVKNAKAFGFDSEWLEDGSMKITTEILPAIRVDKRTGKTMWFNSSFHYSIMGRYKGDANKLTAMFPNGDLIKDETIEIMKEVMDEVRVSLKWHHKDVMMIDNRAVLHSKDGFVAPPRRVLVSYFKDHQGPI